MFPHLVAKRGDDVGRHIGFAVGRSSELADAVVHEPRSHSPIAEEFADTGVMSYLSKPRGFLAANCDIDNDGRQDIFIGYSWMEPQLFFNRGFRSFGDARMFTPDGGALPKEIGQGVQAACAADLNSDGIEDIAAVMTDGELYVFPRKADGADVGLALRVALDPAGSCAGPVNVVASEEKRSYGAWPVSSGSSAFFGRREAGPITVKWRLPGGEEKKKEIVLEDRPVLLTIGGKD